MKTLLYGLLFGVLFAQVAIADDQPIVKHKMNFLPITAFLGCSNKTVKSDKIFLSRSDVADMGVNRLECVDKTRSVHEVQPSGVGVIYEKNIDTWSVLIIFNKSDSSNIEKISRDGIGRKIVFEVEGKVVAAAVLNAPITNAKVEISSDSKERAHHLSMAFLDPKDRW